MNPLDNYMPLGVLVQLFLMEIIEFIFSGGDSQYYAYQQVQHMGL